jgi:hypothetical protein
MANKKSFVLRIDPQISSALERWSEDEFRSMNGQIEYILFQALKKAGRLPPKKKYYESEGANPAAIDPEKSSFEPEGNIT